MREVYQFASFPTCALRAFERRRPPISALTVVSCRTWGRTLGSNMPSNAKGLGIRRAVSHRLIHLSEQKALGLEGKQSGVILKTTSLDSDEAIRILKKIDRNLLPLMIAMNFIQFMDKATLGNAAILGLNKDLKLTAGQYNWLGTIFYVSYLVFEYPQNRLLQRFPVGRYLAINGFIWAFLVGVQAACTKFWQLFLCRLLLGAFEGSATSAFMITTSMFYTHEEQTSRTAYWLVMNGVSVIVNSFLGYGILHMKNARLQPWQWFYIMTAMATFMVSMALFFFYADSPESARFLTPQEREKAIIRIKVNQTGVENKQFKRYQAVEAVRDPKTWGFFAYMVIVTLPNITTQQSLIIHSFGYDLFKTTLLSSIIGVVHSVSVLVGSQLVRSQKGARTLVAVSFTLPNTAAAIMSVILPFSAKVPLLVAIYLSWFSSTGMVIMLGWITSATAGHTKRITVQSIAMIGYCTGNIIAPQLWQQRFKPRNIVPWSIILAAYLTGICIIISMGLYLRRQNMIRDKAKTSRYSGELSHGAGSSQEKSSIADDSSKALDKLYLDLTDLENEDFRYPY